MEKLEYRNRIEEMKDLISKNKFADAMSVAETVNWRKIHNINDLIAGSECYESAGKVEEARDLLLLAHERSPIGRMILYKLCMISIKLKDIDEAQEYYNEFVQIAPHDSLRFILKYNINTAKGADVSTLITILEQLKENDFIEEWAYELAYLYHKTNQAEKCISLCDEIILWFGDGPVVERALELKMLYQPLDKTQEDKYRSFQQKKDGITEISPKPVAESSEILPAIANIKLPTGPERFDTINLQAEIKKNIDEIMKATDTGEVSENMDNIKTLVEEIPYLKVPEEEKSNEVDDSFSVNDTFQQYLEEGYDGQISLRLTDETSSDDEQIEGQMTIEDVLAEWEKTKRAAEAAMEDAKSKELESARARALREANNVLNRLEGAMSKLNSGMTSADLLKEEYLAGQEVEPEVLADAVESSEPVSDENIDEPNNYEEEKGFSIPKLNINGQPLGSIDIPIVHPEEAAIIGATAGVAGAIVHSAENAVDETSNWRPPTLNNGENEDVDLKEASEMIADVNKVLQQEIDRLTAEEPVQDSIPEAVPEFTPEEPAVSIDEIELPVIQLPEDILADIRGVSESTFESEIMEDDSEYVDSDSEMMYQESEMMPEYDITDELPEISIPDIAMAEMESPEEVPLPEIAMPEMMTSEELPIISENVIEPEEYAQLVDENVLSQAIQSEVPNLNLDEEDLETFSYFLPISGMKEKISQALAGVSERINQPHLNSGNIMIIGEPGSGKTQMATSIIRVLEKKTGYPKGGIGKISGEKLNEKDIQKLYSKIQGGCLIIETAGDISKETAVTLSLLMEQDNTGTIIIIEDNKRGIDRALAKDSSFAKRFTEKIVIPAFTIDELVSFGRTYAYEAGCTIDDMGVLALYNRINNIGRYNHATTIKEVAEIMDGAIEKSTRGGFFNKPKYDRDGNVILKEKDFD
ncbi:hypothetical protein SAMN02910298_02709 [Pseudobutyrivibrio sp. YE44]|uniref:hypothetical protein n=1 Tax=Pseudobutyrivibrio sp. YE44 TaxID=1520802 RepID=UPI00089277B4|nr:hypothetical protein [Pseudobutyrivibrio sp. YE44]SDB52911.1 hypothetical protein SAMN02910298_02709 [Pseudobutyrivibrio sp. YE44]